MKIFLSIILFLGMLVLTAAVTIVAPKWWAAYQGEGLRVLTPYEDEATRLAALEEHSSKPAPKVEEPKVVEPEVTKTPEPTVEPKVEDKPEAKTHAYPKQKAWAQSPRGAAQTMARMHTVDEPRGIPVAQATRTLPTETREPRVRYESEPEVVYVSPLASFHQPAVYSSPQVYSPPVVSENYEVRTPHPHRHSGPSYERGSFGWSRGASNPGFNSRGIPYGTYYGSQGQSASIQVWGNSGRNVH